MNDVCIALVAPNGSEHKLLYDAVILVPDLLFLAFLVYTARRCYDILTRSPSMIMWTYYCLVWAVTICNVLRIIVQLAASSESHHHVLLWNVLWLITRFIMTTLEVSVVVFLLHGYVSSSSAALQRTVVISSAVSLLSTILEAVFIFPLHIQLYIVTQNPQGGLQNDMVWHKWAFWLANALSFMLVYLGLMLLPLTRWRDLLPSRDMFHTYVRILFAVNLVASVGAIMIAKHSSAGYCVFGVTNILYYGCYAPLLYYTFLASFFQSEDIDLENYYYSEMSDAGFLDMSMGNVDDPFINAP